MSTTVKISPGNMFETTWGQPQKYEHFADFLHFKGGFFSIQSFNYTPICVIESLHLCTYIIEFTSKELKVILYGRYIKDF